MSGHIRMVTPLPGPRSAALLARQERSVAHALSPHVPIIIDHAAGALITDVDGNTFIDLAGGLGCMNVGYSNPAVVRAIQAATAAFTHTDFSVVPYESYVRLAERLCALTPGNFAKKAAFFNAGVEAVENAVKLARKFTGRPAVIAMEGAFHGRTNLGMALTSKPKPYKQGFGPFTPEIYRVAFPYVYRWPGSSDPAVVAEQAVAALERAFITRVASEDTAAVILEPVQGEGGYVPAPPGYLERVQEVCRRHGVLLIFDEIQSGFCRTGRFLAAEHYGVEPDLICVGKSIAAGMPLSGVVGRADIFDGAPDGTIGGTYVGNPVACAAALAVLDEVERLDLSARAAQLGRRLMQRWHALAERCEIVGDVRGLGAMVGVELVLDRTSKVPAATATSRVLKRCMERGVIAVKCGIYGNVLRFPMPLVITDQQLDEALDVMVAAVEAEAAVAAPV